MWKIEKLTLTKIYFVQSTTYLKLVGSQCSVENYYKTRSHSNISVKSTLGYIHNFFGTFSVKIVIVFLTTFPHYSFHGISVKKREWISEISILLWCFQFQPLVFNFLLTNKNFMKSYTKQRASLSSLEPTYLDLAFDYEFHTPQPCSQKSWCVLWQLIIDNIWGVLDQWFNFSNFFHIWLY